MKKTIKVKTVSQYLQICTNSHTRSFHIFTHTYTQSCVNGLSDTHTHTHTSARLFHPVSERLPLSLSDKYTDIHVLLMFDKEEQILIERRVRLYKEKEIKRENMECVSARE